MSDEVRWSYLHLFCRSYLSFWGNPFCRAVGSRNRFCTILTHLRFDNLDIRLDRRQKDPLAPIWKLWDWHQEILQSHYVPGAYLTIDEQLVPFRGRCKFRVYMSSKPDKYGLKIFGSVTARQSIHWKQCHSLERQAEPQKLGKQQTLCGLLSNRTPKVAEMLLLIFTSLISSLPMISWSSVWPALALSARTNRSYPLIVHMPRREQD